MSVTYREIRSSGRSGRRERARLVQRSLYERPDPDGIRRHKVPYCARIDHTRGLLWVSQCGNDAIARVDMTTKKVIEYRLPTHIAFIWHLDVDQETGDV